MGGHLLGSSVGSIQDLAIVDTRLVAVVDLLMKSLHLIKAGRLGQALASSSLSSQQPGGELLDASPVLGPELDVIGVLVALDLGVGRQAVTYLVILASSSL